MSNRLTIGVAIPCYKGHIAVLRYLLDSIEKQTRRPDKVVVSCSSSVPSDIPTNYFGYSFHLAIYTHEEVKNAAQNRNVASSYLDTDVVTFIDADDQMHPQRIEIMETCFKNPAIAVLLHCYDRTSDRDFEMHTDDEFPFEYNKIFVCPWRSVQHINYPRADIIHNGQITVRKKVLDHVHFREESDFFGREDTFFAGDVILSYPNQNAYCPLRLTKYSPSRTQIKASLDDIYSYGVPPQELTILS